MKRFHSLLAFFTLAFLPTFLPAQSHLQEAESTLRVAVDQVLQIAQSARTRTDLVQQVRPILERYISFERMTQLAIGPGWRSLSDQERIQAAADFATLVIRSYSDKLTPGEFPEIQIRPARDIGQGKVEVPTTLRYQGSKYEVAYRMQKFDNWKVTDVIIEGVSFVANYRSQFDAIYKKGGAHAIANTLRQTANRNP